jgi:hypothetical protein
METVHGTSVCDGSIVFSLYWNRCPTIQVLFASCGWLNPFLTLTLTLTLTESPFFLICSFIDDNFFSFSDNVYSC